MVKKVNYIFVLLMVLPFLLRSVFFATHIGGVEHDSGWYLGVARNLAQRGIYASYTNTVTETMKGTYPSIHGRVSVQDDNGFVYFPAGVTVGPGYIIPEALMLKIFGYDWWQFRAWPLLAFMGLLIFTFLIIWQVGGLLALILFQLWLWAVPQFTIAFSYEALSEHVALFYLMISFILTYFAFKRKRNFLLMLSSGLFFSFSFLTKTLFMLAFPSFLLLAVWDVIANRGSFIVIIKKWSIFLIGLIAPLILFESYKYFFLVNNFGYEAWKGVQKDISLVLKSGGSGIDGLFKKIEWGFFKKKYSIWMDVGVQRPMLAWLLFLSSFLVLISKKVKKYKVLFFLIFSSSVFWFLWFLLIARTGWARHAWQALFLGMALICIFVGNLLSGKLKLSISAKIFFWALLVLMLTNLSYKNMNFKMDLNQNSVNTWRTNRFVRSLEGFPSTPILNLSHQKDIINFFEKNINPRDRVYYVGWFLNAEVSPLVDKVFFSLDRYLTNGQVNPNSGFSFVIFGPYQQGQWSLMPPQYLSDKVGKLCKKVVFQNPSYLVCELKSGIKYVNNAYN